MWALIFNYTDTLHSDDFVYICESRSQSKTAEHFLPKTCTMCAAFTDANAYFLKQLLSDRRLFLWYSAFFLLFVGFVQPLITDSVEFKPTVKEDDYLPYNFDAKSMFIGLTNFLDQSGPAVYFSPRNGLKYASTNDNSPLTLYDWLLWQQTRIHSCRNFRSFWKLCVCILRNKGVNPYCWPISVLIRPNTDR